MIENNAPFKKRPTEDESPEITSDQNGDFSLFLDPPLTSTPLAKLVKEEKSPSILSGGNNPFVSVIMDSGFYDSFNITSGSSESSVLENMNPKHVNSKLGSLLGFWRDKEKLLKS